jgi:hypothetical protein
MYYFTLLLLILLPTLCSAQKETTNWYFGDRVGLSFANGTPVLLNDGKMSTTEGCAVMSDKTTGELLFYTDGSTIWNGNHDVVNNGTGLMGGASGTQTALIIPNPGNDKEYFIFTVPDLTTSVNPFTRSMYYSIVSVANPDVDVLAKNIKLLDDVSEKLTGSLDCTGKGFWVVTHHRTNNEFYSFHITNQGVTTTPVISTYNETLIDHTAGYIRISPNRSKLAIATHNANSFLALFDFNPATGQISNYNLLGNPSNNDKFYGVSFSPDNSKLYAIGKTVLTRSYESAIFQYEVDLPTPTQILNSVVVFPVRSSVSFVSAIQMGMDDKLYIASTFRNFVDVIHTPNLKGTLCNFEEDAISLPRQCKLGLPNFINYFFYRLGLNDTVRVACDHRTVQIGKPAVPNETYLWEPAKGLDNPTSAQPIAVVSKPITYTRTVTNSNGCISTDSVIVLLADDVPDAGPDLSICLNEKATIGSTALPGYTYSWSPQSGLSDPTSAQPSAQPLKTTDYIITSTSPTGCVSSDTVRVVVNPLVPLQFTLTPDTVEFVPNEKFQTELRIPNGVQQWNIRLLYNTRIMRFDTILSRSAGIQLSLPIDQNTGQLKLQGTGGNGTAVLQFKTYLPNTNDSVFAVQMIVDSTKNSIPCGRPFSTDITIKTGDYCGRNFRYVSGTGNTYFLSAANHEIQFGVGLSGNVRLEVFDYMGRSLQTLADTRFEAGNYSATIDVPTGLYFCRMSAGVFEKVVKMVVVK